MSKPKRILIVDDDQRSRVLLSNMLESLGYDSEPAADGLEALEKVRLGVDLVLMDVLMPGMSGFEVVSKIRHDPECSGIPIIVVTVLTAKEDRLRAVEVGANDFIVKPVDKLELQVRMASLLKMKEAQDAVKHHLANLEVMVQKRTAALLESEKRFRRLFENALDFIYLKDGNLRYTDLNRASTELLGLLQREVIGKTDRDFFGPEYAAQTERLEGRVLSGQTVESEHCIFIGSRPIKLDVVRFPMRDASGEITGICAIGREIRESPEVLSGSADIAQEYPSAAMRSSLESARLAAQTESIVVLTGESGSGKDYLARRIHEHSRRAAGPFYAINCAAIPPELAESELFGHEPGAFTGAIRRKRGLLELAEGGTLLLNEIGELPVLVQAKLLTFLDTYQFTRVGGEKGVTTDARLMAATNRDLQKEVAEGRFRKDLYYRINVLSIRVPCLRDRTEDIPILVEELGSRIAAELQLPRLPRIAAHAIVMLRNYSWPGNVRELRNVLERALILSRGRMVRPEHLGLEEMDAVDRAAGVSLTRGRTLSEVLAEMERSMIEEALRRTDGKRLDAANMLGVSRFALSRHIAKLAIDER